jgi:ABC-type maltose transport system permease subunit
MQGNSKDNLNDKALTLIIKTILLYLIQVARRTEVQMTVITSRSSSSREHYSLSEVTDILTNFGSSYLNLRHTVPFYQPCNNSLRIPAIHALTPYDNRNVRPSGAA